MHAVLGIDLKSVRTIFFNYLIDSRRAVELGGFLVEAEISRDGNSLVLKNQMARLVFFVVGVRQEHAG